MAALCGLALLLGGGGAVAQVNAVISDGQRDFAEGVLRGYVLQAGGVTLCADPWVIGRHISCTGRLRLGGQVWSAPDARAVQATTNGHLGGMAVVDGQGRVICESPGVALGFRDGRSWILCP